MSSAIAKRSLAKPHVAWVLSFSRVSYGRSQSQAYGRQSPWRLLLSTRLTTVCRILFGASALVLFEVFSLHKEPVNNCTDDLVRDSFFAMRIASAIKGPTLARNEGAELHVSGLRM